MHLLGFDEAGRGCVLGPLVVGGYLLHTDRAEEVRAAGGRDSKALTAAKRTAAAARLKGLALEWRTIHITPEQIDGGNLNDLEEEAFGRIIDELKPDRIQIDAPVPSAHIGKYCRRLAERYGIAVDRITAANQAEDRWPSVGAASIMAKTERDAAMDQLREEFGALGSGYPSDPKTRSYLKALIENDTPLPPFVRSRWGTVTQMIEDRDLRRRQGTLF